jgi:hypothetical protein
MSATEVFKTIFKHLTKPNHPILLKQYFIVIGQNSGSEEVGKQRRQEEEKGDDRGDCQT